MPNRKKRSSKSPNINRSLLLTTGILLIFGVFMIYDATAIQSQSIYGNAYRFVMLHITWILVGLFGFWFFYQADYSKLSKVAYLFLLLSIIFLVFLAIVSLLPCGSSIGFAPCINGANRWILLNPTPFPEIPFVGVLGFQPAELAKFALILYLSFQLSKNFKKNENPFIVYLITSGLIAFLILLQPNLSTAVLIFILGTMVYFSSGASIKPLILISPVFLFVVALAIITSPYRRARLATYLSGEVSEEVEESYHVKQVSIALGSGGLFGVGFGESRQKYQYLPEVASDSIFAIIGEEFGYVGTTLVLIVFGYLIYQGLLVARDAPDLLGRMLATGITSWLGLQFIINIAAMARLIPLTGVPIPLLSYGGSSMLFSLMGVGVLGSVSRNT